LSNADSTVTLKPYNKALNENELYSVLESFRDKLQEYVMKKGAIPFKKFMLILT